MRVSSVTSGYVIEMTFARVCREFLASYERYAPHLLNWGGYSTPRTGVPCEQMPKQYRGLQREPLQGWMEVLRGWVVEPTDQELEASLFLMELVRAGKADENDIILALEDAREVVRKIKPPVEREIIWARRLDVAGVAAPPAETVLLGYDLSGFCPAVSYSAIASIMFFGYPRPGDEEGLRLKAYHDKLNRWGLFDTPADAEEYLKEYFSVFPDERRYANYLIEVREAH
jgi:hypothetical protein